MNKASIFMTTSWVGLAGLGLAIAGLAIPGIEVATLAGMIVATLSAIAMLWARKADEYTTGLWNAGASVAFGAMLLAYPGLPFAEGAYDGLTGAQRAQDISASIVPGLAVVSFYIGLFAKRGFGDA